MNYKLELKHLAPYLPYGLKVLNRADTFEIIAMNKGAVFFKGGLLVIEDIKPILRPLSDLTKQIEHNGERFVPFHKLKSIYGNDLTIDYKYNITFEDGVEGAESYSYSVDLLDCYELYQYLFSWHFDVFGFIDKGLAIDINSLEK